CRTAPCTMGNTSQPKGRPHDGAGPCSVATQGSEPTHIQHVASAPCRRRMMRPDSTRIYLYLRKRHAPHLSRCQSLTACAPRNRLGNHLAPVVAIPGEVLAIHIDDGERSLCTVGQHKLPNMTFAGRVVDGHVDER